MPSFLTSRTLLCIISIGTLPFFSMITPVTSQPSEIKILSASALKAIVSDLAGEFEKETGHRLKVEFATAGAVEKRVLAGETLDVAIATDIQMKGLAEKGLIVAGSSAIIARVGVGIAVKAGAPVPDISSAASLKQSLLAAKSVTYPDPAKGGASGIHFATVVERLGIADALKQRTVLGANPDYVCVSVAKGEVEMCVHQISEITPVKGVTLVGPLPRELQRVTTFAVAPSAKAAAAAAANEFARFLASPKLKARFAAAGLDYRID